MRTLALMLCILAAQAAAAIKQRGVNAEAVRVDVSCPAELDKLVNDAAARHGRLDCPALLAPLSRWSVKEFRKLRIP